MQSFKSIAVILLVSFTAGVLSADNETTIPSVTTIKTNNETETATVAAINNDEPHANARSDGTPTRVPEAAEATTKPPLVHGKVEKKTASTVTNEPSKNATAKPEKKSGVSKVNAGFSSVILVAVVLVGLS